VTAFSQGDTRHGRLAARVTASWQRLTMSQIRRTTSGPVRPSYVSIPLSRR